MPNKWDQYAEKPTANRWAQYAEKAPEEAVSQPASTPAPAPQPSLVERLQNSFDQNTRTSPKEPLLETGLKSVVGAIGSPFVHPLNTLKGTMDMIPSSPDLPNTPLKVGGVSYIRDEQNPVVSRGVQAYHDVKEGGIPYAATKLAGEGFGSLALGEAASALPRAAKGVGSELSSIRQSVVGDPNEAALRGLRVGPASNKALRTLSAVEGARPFLQGSRDLADLQSRLPAAKSEIWGPYTEALDKVGNRQTPLGSVRELEARRMEVSAQLRALKSGDPNAIAIANQKGLTQADLLKEERSIKSVLDPELKSAGIDPEAIRRSFSNIGTIERRVAGKSTLAEPDKPFGFGKMANLDLHKPLNAPAQILEGAKDIIAGRPLFKGKPTDIAIREAFRTGGPKPSFRLPSEPSVFEPAGYLESSTIGEPGGPDYSVGRIPARPSVITPQPPILRALPSSVEAGEAQPMIGIRARPHPTLADDYARVRVAPTSFAEPPVIPQRGFIVDPTGQAQPNPLFLESTQPRGLLSAPLKRKR